MFKIGKSLKNLDAFPKIADEYAQRTNLGGLITTLVSIIVVFLIQSEFKNYWQLKQEYEFLVEPSNKGKMQINIDMSIAMACAYLNVDVLDVTGQSLNVKRMIKLVPSHFEAGNAHEFRNNLITTEGISNLINKAEQGTSELDLAEDSAKDGCRVVGSFKVKKVAGNFHVTALGHGHGGVHTPHDAFNFTHRIDQLSFGENYPKLINPLDNSIDTVASSILVLWFKYLG